MHVPPAADGAAEVVGEGGVLVGEADGADERRSLHTTPVLFLQFDQNCTKQTWRSRERTKEEIVHQQRERVCVCLGNTNVVLCWVKHRELLGEDVFVHAERPRVVVRDVK